MAGIGGRPRKEDTHAAFRNEAKDIAASQLPKLMRFWLQVVDDPNQKTADRMRASENIAAYGLGKPTAEPPRKGETGRPRLLIGIPTEDDLADADTDPSFEGDEDND